MTIPQIISSGSEKKFSLEVLPPLKGNGAGRLFERLDRLVDFGPSYINITTHRSELVYKSTSDGLYQRVSQRVRPGTVALAAAIQQRYRLPAVPHIICSGYSRLETEYALIDLSFLGITNLLVLRGDKAKHENRFTPVDGGHSHACQLQNQISDFNRGMFIDGTHMDIVADTPFDYGVAGYPEKHEESPNAEMDMMYLRQKIDAGASYIVTQMFFDNARYFDFVSRCRNAGINVPIIPGIKPIVSRSQLTVLPKVFHVDLPTPLASALMNAADDDRAKAIGIEWCAMQMRELYSSGVKSIHIYSHNASASVESILKQVL